MQAMQVPYKGAVDTGGFIDATIAKRAFELAEAMEKQAKLYDGAGE